MRFFHLSDLHIGKQLHHYNLKEDQEHIFERFFRVDKSHSREIGGTGLGLAIARNAIVMHHGVIKVYSKEGEGTTFTVRVPLVYEK